MDNLASINALYNEAKDELEGSKADQAELTELREMKSDIERKEKQQAGIIENQVGVSCLLWQWCKGEGGGGGQTQGCRQGCREHRADELSMADSGCRHQQGNVGDQR